MTAQRKTIARAVLSTGVSIACLASVAHAQIDVIEVTAQKRRESIQDVPISVSALSGERLEELGLDDLGSIAYQIPNFYYFQSSQFINAFIGVRGVSSTGNSGFESSVGVFIDEVFVPRPGATVGSLFDIEAVEVLRGPQGTLFGRNTSMGALNIRTAAPSDEFGVGLRLWGGNIDGAGASGHVTGGLTDTLSARVSFQVQDFNAYLFNSFEDEDELDRQSYAVRGRLNWEPTDRLRFKLISDYQRIDYRGASHLDFKPDTVTPRFVGAVGAFLNAALDFSDPFDQTVQAVSDDDSQNEQWGATLISELDVGDHTITSVTAYRDWEDDVDNQDVVGLPGDILERDRLSTTDNFSQEIRFASPYGQLVDYMLGVYYYTEDYGTDSIFRLGGDLCNGVYPAIAPTLVGACNAPIEQDVVDIFFQELESYAVFGNATVNLTDGLRLTGGVRWSRDEKNGRFERTRNNIAAITFAATSQLGLDEAEQISEKVTYSVNASYDVTDEVMVYASTSTGFKSGGINSEAQDNSQPRTFEPELTENFEVGVKSQFFDNRLLANVTLFHTTLEDFQERTFTGVGFIVGNAGTLRARGLEVDAQAQPTDKLSLNFSLAYLDSEFTDFENAPGLPGGPPQDLTGERRQFSPAVTFAFGGQWEDTIPSAGLRWFARADYQYTGEQNLSSNLNPQAVQEAYGLLNLRAGIGSDDGVWQLAGFVQNAADKGYCVSIFNQVLGGAFGAVDPTTNTAAQRCVVGLPRSYGAELRFKF